MSKRNIILDLLCVTGLELNQEYDGTFYTPALKEFFEKRGAKIDEQKVIFNSGLRAPVSTSRTAR